jgi:hypothetical protein
LIPSFAARIHHAGALAYLGSTDEARSLLTLLANGDELPPDLRPLVGLALHSPTYAPDGQGGIREIRL